MTDTNLSFDQVMRMIKQMRDAGYAVAVFTPEEVGEIDPSQVEDKMIEAGNICIEWECVL